MAANNLVRIYEENVHPMPNMPGFIGIDFDAFARAVVRDNRLAEAIAREQKKLEEEMMEAKRVAKAEASLKRRTTHGANGTVDPIRDKADVLKIAQYFYDKHQIRNSLMFLIGCSVGLRGEDLCKVKVGDITEDGRYRTKEQKTGKYRTVVLNNLAMTCYHELVRTIPNCTEDSMLFQSQKGDNQSISRHSFGRILRQAGKDLHLPYKLGTHSMRKTFGYHLFMSNQQTPEILANLQKIFQHDSSATTLRYIGLSNEREEELYKNLDFGFDISDVKEEK